MKHSNLRSFVSGMVVMLLIVCMAGTAVAKTGSQSKSLTYKDIKVEIDGQRIALKDADGGVVEPFIIDGTTYLPIRAIASALGLQVGWDNKTNTVILTSPDNEPVQPEPQPQPQPEPDPAPALTPEQAFRESLKQYAYVGSAESDKYHRPTCRWTSKINDENLVHFDSVEEAQAAGYEPCGTCNPK